MKMNYNELGMMLLMHSLLLASASPGGLPTQQVGKHAEVAIKAVSVISIVSRSKTKVLVAVPDVNQLQGAATLYPLNPTKLSEGTTCVVQQIIPVFSDAYIPEDYQTAAKRIWSITKSVGRERHEFLLFGAVGGYFLRRVHDDGRIEAPGQKILEPSDKSRALILLLKDAKKGPGISLIEESALPMPAGPNAWDYLKRILG